jgi:hypothetical protein
MKQPNYFTPEKCLSLGLVSGALVLLGIASPIHAQIVTLSHNNSIAHVNVGSDAGMFDWSVLNGNQYVPNLKQQWFWFRVGDNGPERPINTISAPTFTTPDARSLYTKYNNGSFGVSISYLLTGQAPGSIGHDALSDIAETISITNGTSSSLQFHFYQYSDFDLGGTSGNQTIQLGKNLQNLFNEAVQANGTDSLSETVVSPGANHGEAALFNATLLKLQNGNPDTLNDVAGPVGPGDATWALEWDLTIPAFSSFGISKDKSIHLKGVPEPTSLALVSLGVAACLLRRRLSQL